MEPNPIGGGFYTPMPGYTGETGVPSGPEQRIMLLQEQVSRMRDYIMQQVYQRAKMFIGDERILGEYIQRMPIDRVVMILNEIKDTLKTSLSYLKTISTTTMGMHINIAGILQNTSNFAGLAPTFGGYNVAGLGLPLLAAIQGTYTQLFGGLIGGTYAGLRDIAIATGFSPLYTTAQILSQPLAMSRVREILQPFMITGAIRGNLGTVFAGMRMMTPEAAATATTLALTQAPGRLSTTQLTAYINRFALYANQLMGIIGAPPEAILGFLARMQQENISLVPFMTGLANLPLRFGGGTLETLGNLLYSVRDIYGQIPGLGIGAGMYQALGAISAFPFDIRRQLLAMQGQAMTVAQLGGRTFMEFLPLAIARGAGGGNLIDIITAGAGAFAQNPLLARGLAGITGMFLNPMGVAQAMQEPIRFYAKMIYGTREPSLLQTINILQLTMGLDFETAYATALAFQGTNVAMTLAQLQPTPIMTALPGSPSRLETGIRAGSLILAPIGGLLGTAISTLFTWGPLIWIGGRMLRAVTERYIRNIQQALGGPVGERIIRAFGSFGPGAAEFSGQILRGISQSLGGIRNRIIAPTNIRNIVGTTFRLAGGWGTLGTMLGSAALTGLAGALFGEDILAHPAFQLTATLAGTIGLIPSPFTRGFALLAPMVVGAGIWAFNRIRGRDFTLQGMTPLEATAFIKSISRGEISSGDPRLNAMIQSIAEIQRGTRATGSILFNTSLALSSGEFARVAQALANYDSSKPRDLQEGSLILRNVIGGILGSNNIDISKLSPEEKQRLGSFIYSQIIARGIDEKIAQDAIRKSGLKISPQDVSRISEGRKYLSQLALANKTVGQQQVQELIRIVGSKETALALMQQFGGTLTFDANLTNFLTATFGAEGMKLLSEEQRKKVVKEIVSQKLKGRADTGAVIEKVQALLQAGIPMREVISAISTQFRIGTEDAKEIVTTVQVARLTSDIRGPSADATSSEKVIMRLSDVLDKLGKLIEQKIK